MIPRVPNLSSEVALFTLFHPLWIGLLRQKSIYVIKSLHHFDNQTRGLKLVRMRYRIWWLTPGGVTLSHPRSLYPRIEWPGGHCILGYSDRGSLYPGGHPILRHRPEGPAWKTGLAFGNPGPNSSIYLTKMESCCSKQFFVSRDYSNPAVYPILVSNKIICLLNPV